MMGWGVAGMECVGAGKRRWTAVVAAVVMVVVVVRMRMV
jgi:hypothetical protein